MATSRPELVFCILLRTCAGTSDEVGFGDCRHDCHKEESHQEGIDNVHDDHDDHCSASGSGD